ncbi:MAG: putative Ig domain-containing protein [Myxococcota bacterium]
MKRILPLSLSVVGITVMASCGDDLPFTTIPDPDPIEIAETSLPDGTVGVDYRATIEALNGTQRQIRWQVIAGEDGSQALPPGLFVTSQLNPLEISGRPRVAGSFAFTLRVTDSTDAESTIDLTINVNPDPDAIAITAEGLDTFPTEPVGRPGNSWIVGDMVDAQFSASGGAGAPYVFSATNVSALPPGLVLTEDGALSGEFQRRGTFSFQVQASDVNGAVAQASFVLVVNTFTSTLEIVINCDDPENGKVDDLYECEVCAEGGVPPYEFVLGQDGGVPPGIELLPVQPGESCTLLRGIPTETGSFAFRVNVIDSVRERAGTSLFPAIRPRDPPLRVTGRLNRLVPAPEEEFFAFPQLEQNVPYEFEVFGTGGTQEGYSWEVCDGELPAGMMLTNGTPAAIFAGAPSDRGITEFELCLEDSDQDQVARRRFEVRVGAAIQPVAVVTPGGPLPPITCGAPVTAGDLQLEADDGLAPYGWDIDGLPEGLDFQAQSNPVTIVGTATSSGTFTVDATVYDSRNQTGAQSFTLEVAGPCL